MGDFIIFSLAVFFTAQLVRAFPWPDRLRSKKPLSCHACMSGWSAIGWLIAKAVVLEGALHELTPFYGAAGVSYLLMHVLESLPRQWPLPPSDEA